MSCYRKGGCGPYEMRSCAECPASKPEYATKEQEPVTNRNGLTGWISVEDRLPPPYVEVLAYRKNFSREGGFATLEHLILWHDESLVWNNDTTTWRSKVTHWMPLPEPPEVEG